MANVYSEFLKLLPDSPLLIGTVESSDGDNHVLTLIDGGTLTARGKATVGAKVYVRDGVIEGTAPALSQVIIEV